MLIQWCCQRRATQEVRASYLECQEDISDLKAYLEETRIADGVLALCSWIAMVQEATLQISCKMGPHGASLQVEGGLPLFACLLMFRLNVPPSQYVWVSKIHGEAKASAYRRACTGCRLSGEKWGCVAFVPQSPCRSFCLVLLTFSAGVPCFAFLWTVWRAWDYQHELCEMLTSKRSLADQY